MRIHEHIRNILFQRHAPFYTTVNELFSASYDDISSPYCLNDMEKAVSRIMHALQNGETIGIYSDYDADGVPGAVILWDALQILQGKTAVYIPHRQEEGYGFHTRGVDYFIEQGVTLVITIDVGTSDYATVQYASERGVDVIITDHHEPSHTLPDAVALVNPKIGTYPDPMICGCATVFQLIRALLEQSRAKGVEIPEGWEKWLLDMVGIATLSDMVPLVRENRIFARYGLLVLKKTRRKGIQELCSLIRLPFDEITEESVVFQITPKLNSASRMGSPQDAFQLLIAQERDTAKMLAQKLVTLNDTRKQAVAQACKRIMREVDLFQEIPKALVVGDRLLSHGIIGLVASKLVEKYKTNVFVWSEHHDGTLKGSCRSYGSYDVFQAMSECADMFLQFGGHKQAGGFSIEYTHVHTLSEKLSQIFGNQECVEHSQEDIFDIQTHEYTQDVRDTVRLFSPYGVGNPQPIFQFRGTITMIRMFGKGNLHKEIIVDSRLSAKIFFFREATLSYTTWNEGDIVAIQGNIVHDRFSPHAITVIVRDIIT